MLCNTYARMSYFTSTHSFIVIILCFLTGGCSQRALQDARETVHQADSLWHAGQMYDDSAALAQTYETLDAWRYFYADDYAHACYHYGKLLRAKEDPVSAMQAFIHATHSRTRDYHILGRVYSNMGDICHLAGEYPLSYDMYQHSGEWYLRNGDTLLYYYDLNNMAYEMAVLHKKEQCLLLLDSIHLISHLQDEVLDQLCLVSLAKAYLMIQQYDSAIYFASCIDNLNYMESAEYLILAQAYDDLGITDSALVYAEKVLKDPYATYQSVFDAIYVILHNDSTLEADSINALASQREDIRYYEYEPIKEQLSKAVQLLELDINRKPDWRWLYTLIAVVLFICSSFVLAHVWKKRELHQQISAEIEMKQNKIDALSHRQDEHRRQLLAEVESACKHLSDSDNWKKELCWNNYSGMCEIVNLRFYDFVTCLHPFHLSEKQVRLCVLILLKASTEQMVDNIPYAKSGLGKFKLTTACKLGTTTREMRTFLLNLLS